MPRLFPLFANLRGRRVLVVGAGVVAARKIAALRDTGAEIVVVADTASDEIATWAAQGVLSLSLGEFADAHLDGTWLVVAATNDTATNRRIAAAAEFKLIESYTYANVGQFLSFPQCVV